MNGRVWPPGLLCLLTACTVVERAAPRAREHRITLTPRPGSGTVQGLEAVLESEASRFRAGGGFSMTLTLRNRTAHPILATTIGDEVRIRLDGSWTVSISHSSSPGATPYRAIPAGGTFGIPIRVEVARGETGCEVACTSPLGPRYTFNSSRLPDALHFQAIFRSEGMPGGLPKAWQGTLMSNSVVIPVGAMTPEERAGEGSPGAGEG